MTSTYSVHTQRFPRETMLLVNINRQSSFNAAMWHLGNPSSHIDLILFAKKEANSFPYTPMELPLPTEPTEDQTEHLARHRQTLLDWMPDNSDSLLVARCGQGTPDQYMPDHHWIPVKAGQAALPNLKKPTQHPTPEPHKYHLNPFSFDFPSALIRALIDMAENPTSVEIRISSLYPHTEWESRTETLLRYPQLIEKFAALQREAQQSPIPALLTYAGRSSENPFAFYSVHWTASPQEIPPALPNLDEPIPQEEPNSWIPEKPESAPSSWTPENTLPFATITEAKPVQNIFQHLNLLGHLERCEYLEGAIEPLLKGESGPVAMAVLLRLLKQELQNEIPSELPEVLDEIQQFLRS